MLAAPAAAQQSPGERAFQRCYARHDVGPDAPALQGPSLRGVWVRDPAERRVLIDWLARATR